MKEAEKKTETCCCCQNSGEKSEEKKESKVADELTCKVEEILETLRINLQMDGGDIQLVEITEDKIVKVHFLGACCGCPSAKMTLKYYIERAIKEQLPDIKEVVMA